MEKVVQFYHRAFAIAAEIQAESGPKIVDWRKHLTAEKHRVKIEALKEEVESFASRFPLPGCEDF